MFGATVFSTLDANKVFWQIKLTENSSKLVTFNTPFGRYKFLRLSYGYIMVIWSETFHRCFQDIFSDINGVQVYIDDIIYGKHKIEHNDRLNKVFKRARESGVKFNLDKCRISVGKVKYMGHVFFPKRNTTRYPNKVAAIASIKQRQRR